jgi:hypothetical protein
MFVPDGSRGHSEAIGAMSRFGLGRGSVLTKTGAGAPWKLARRVGARISDGAEPGNAAVSPKCPVCRGSAHEVAQGARPCTPPVLEPRS